jgi:hypothetical protein
MKYCDTAVTAVKGALEVNIFILGVKCRYRNDLRDTHLEFDAIIDNNASKMQQQGVTRTWICMNRVAKAK